MCHEAHNIPADFASWTPEQQRAFIDYQDTLFTGFTPDGKPWPPTIDEMEPHLRAIIQRR